MSNNVVPMSGFVIEDGIAVNYWVQTQKVRTIVVNILAQVFLKQFRRVLAELIGIIITSLWLPRISISPR